MSRASWVGRGATWLILLAAGCASTPPSSFYTLSPWPGRAESQAPSADGLGIGLGPVSFPAFLDRPQIVSRETHNRLAMDEFHRWGGTLQDDFLRVWSENLSQLLGTSRVLVFPSEIRYPLDVRIAADVLAFERDADGQALLKVRWTLLDGSAEQVRSVRETLYRRPILPPGDANASIAALSQTLADFSQDVAETLRALPRATQTPTPISPPTLEPLP